MAKRWRAPSRVAREQLQEEVRQGWARLRQMVDWTHRVWENPHPEAIDTTYTVLPDPPPRRPPLPPPDR